MNFQIKNFLVVSFLLGSLFAGPTDTTLYTELNPPTSTDGDSIVNYFMNYTEIGRFLRNRDFQKSFYSVFNLSDSLRMTADNLGFFKTDNSRLLEIVQDTVYVNYLDLTGFRNMPVTPDSLPDADYEVANKKYVDERDYKYNQDITTSVSGLVQLNYSATDWTRADNTSESACKYQLGIVIDQDTGSDNGTVMLKGIYTTSGLTAGAAYYVGAISGTYTAALPTSSTGVVVRKIGYALSTTELYFNPSNDYVVYK